MKIVLSIAFRNLNRNKLRTIISIIAIAIVVMIVVFIRGLLLGFTESTFSLQIDNFFGHVRVMDKDYQSRELLLSLDYTINGLNGNSTKHLIEEISKIPEVEHVLPRLKFGAMINSEGNSKIIVAYGIDMELESSYGGIETDVIGRIPTSSGEMLVGKGILDAFNLQVGDNLTILFSNVYKSLRARTFKIVGVRETGLKQLDDFIYIPLLDAQNMLHLDDDFTEILVMGNSLHQSKVLEASLNNFFLEKGIEEGYLILPWQRANSFMEYFQIIIRLYDIIYIFFIFLGSIVLINTMIMIVRERTFEIGVMGALGLKSNEVMMIFALEGVMMGIIGSLLGSIGGGIITYHLSNIGIDYYNAALTDVKVVFAPAIYPVFSLGNLFVSFLLGGMITTLSCLWPAKKAAQLRPVDALRENN
ncbi:MAG: ABC transporter permease [Halanaerobiales bacterium]